MKLARMSHVVEGVVVLLCLLALNNAASAQRVPDIVWQGAHTNVARAVAYSPDGQQVVSGGDDRTAKLWQASDGTLLRNFVQCAGLRCGSAGMVSFSPDGQTLAATGSGLKFWRVSDGTLLRTLNLNGPPTLSPDWQYVVTSLDRSGYISERPGRSSNLPSLVTLFRLSDGSQVWQASGGGGQEAAFSPDGQMVAAVGRRTGIDIWRVSDGTHLRNIPGPKHDLIFSPDSQYVISTQGVAGQFPYDDTIEVYRVSDGALVQVMSGTGAVGSLALTPDGRVLISTGWDPGSTQFGVIRFWRLSDGALLKTYDQGTGAYTGGIAVSPDGNFFSYTYESSVAVARMPSFACPFHLDQPKAIFQHQGGVGTVQVSASEGCSWTAYSRADWVHIISGASGTGNGTVTYTVDTGPCEVESPTGYYRDGLLIVAEQTYDVSQNECPVGPGHYLIYGQVNDGETCGIGLPGVTVTLSGYASASTQTDQYGNYSFGTQLGQQSYTITASKPGYEFSPQSKAIDKLTYDSGAVFYATTNPYPRHYIVGHVKDTNGQPLSGVVLHFEGAAPYPQQTSSDSNGFYGFDCLAYGGNFTITPEYSGYTFTPPSRTYNSLTANQTAADFVGMTGTSSLSISGRVLDQEGGGLPDVTVQVQCPQQNMSQTVQTDERGNYQFTGLPQGYSYTVQSSLAGYSFTPTSQTINNMSASQTTDFTAAPLTCAYALSDASQHFSAGAGSGFFTLTTQQGCYWRLSSSVDWISSFSSDGYTGTTISYYVESNPTHNPRGGSIVVGGQTFSITQDAAPDSCQYTVTPLEASFSPEGGQGSVQVNVSAGCEWRARSNDFWLTVTSGSGDRGDGTVTYTVSGNGGAAKTGTLTIAGQIVTVQQAGSGAVSDALLRAEGNPLDASEFSVPRQYRELLGLEP